MPDKGAEETPDADWLRMIDINLNGMFWCCRAFGRAMLERGKGSIVTIGSMSGVIANKPQRQTHYNVSKAGVHHMTRSLAAEWAPRGVRVNSIAPTYIETAMTLGSAQDPDDAQDLDGVHADGAHGPAGGDRRHRPVPRLARLQRDDRRRGDGRRGLHGVVIASQVQALRRLLLTRSAFWRVRLRSVSINTASLCRNMS